MVTQRMLLVIGNLPTRPALKQEMCHRGLWYSRSQCRSHDLAIHCRNVIIASPAGREVMLSDCQIIAKLRGYMQSPWFHIVKSNRIHKELLIGTDIPDIAVRWLRHAGITNKLQCYA